MQQRSISQPQDAAATLQKLAHARDELLARVRQVLEADARVRAAWLSGSYGRGEADEWSDLDLHVAVAEPHLPAFIATHQTLFAQVGRPLLIFGGMPSNSMPGGQFWLVQYAPYMLEIDWNIGPTQATMRPQAAAILFDHVGIPITPPLVPAVEELRRDTAARQLAFFWAMAPIAIKFAGRGHTRLAVKQVDLLKDAYIKLWQALYQPEHLQKEAYHQNRRLAPELDARLPRFGPSIDPLSALATIRAFCQEVARLHALLAELGAAVGDKVVADEVVQEVAALADLAETVAKTGGSSPQHGSRR